jgi:hypothetical protein
VNAERQADINSIALNSKKKTCISIGMRAVSPAGFSCVCSLGAKIEDAHCLRNGREKPRPLDPRLLDVLDRSSAACGLVEVTLMIEAYLRLGSWRGRIAGKVESDPAKRERFVLSAESNGREYFFPKGSS